MYSPQRLAINFSELRRVLSEGESEQLKLYVFLKEQYYKDTLQPLLDSENREDQESYYVLFKLVIPNIHVLKELIGLYPDEESRLLNGFERAYIAPLNEIGSGHSLLSLAADVETLKILCGFYPKHSDYFRGEYCLEMEARSYDLVFTTGELSFFSKAEQDYLTGYNPKDIVSSQRVRSWSDDEADDDVPTTPSSGESSRVDNGSSDSDTPPSLVQEIINFFK